MIRPIALNIILLFVLCMSGVTAQAADDGDIVAYADVANKSEGLTVRGYALARTSYGKAYPTGVYKMTDRGLAENVHLNLDWKMSQSDRPTSSWARSVMSLPNSTI